MFLTLPDRRVSLATGKVTGAVYAQLSPKAARLLRLLVARPSMVITKKALEDELETSEAVVKACVGEIRRLLGTECINTVRGVGFCYLGPSPDSEPAYPRFQSTPAATLGSWTMDWDERQMRGPTGTITLTVLETEFLRVLDAGRPKAVSTEHIVGEVWGPGHDKRKLKKAAFRLRTKLPPEVVLETVPGVGYRLMTHSKERTIQNIGVVGFPEWSGWVLKAPAEAQEAIQALGAAVLAAGSRCCPKMVPSPSMSPTSNHSWPCLTA